MIISFSVCDAQTGASIALRPKVPQSSIRESDSRRLSRRLFAAFADNFSQQYCVRLEQTRQDDGSADAREGPFIAKRFEQGDRDPIRRRPRVVEPSAEDGSCSSGAAYAGIALCGDSGVGRHGGGERQPRTPRRSPATKFRRCVGNRALSGGKHRPARGSKPYAASRSRDCAAGIQRPAWRTIGGEHANRPLPAPAVDQLV